MLPTMVLPELLFMWFSVGIGRRRAKVETAHAGICPVSLILRGRSSLVALFGRFLSRASPRSGVHVLPHRPMNL